MKIPLTVRIQAFFARDEYAFWWSHFTDEEKKLARMDMWELAGVIEEANVRGMEKKRIVAEHMLGVRLAQIQAKASWGSGLLGFVGAIVGAGLSVALASAWQQQGACSTLPSAGVAVVPLTVASQPRAVPPTRHSSAPQKP